MAAFSVSFDGTRLDNASSGTDWTGENSVETDFYYNGSACIVQQVKTSRVTFYYTDPGTAVDFTPSTGTRRVWIAKVIQTNSGSIDGNGLELWIGSSSTAMVGYYVFTNTTYPPTGGWQMVCIDPNATSGNGYGGGTLQTTGTIDRTAISTYFIASDASAIAKSPNLGHAAIDYVASGKGLTGTDGSTGDGNFINFYSTDQGSPSNRWGVVLLRDGILYVNGVLTIGASGTATFFTDTNRVVVFPEHYVYTGFCGVDFDIQNASTDINITNCVFNGRGQAYTTPAHDTRPDYDVIGTSGTLVVNGSTFNGYRQLTLTSVADFQNNSYASGGESITVAGALLNGSTFSGFTGAADDSYIDWNVASDPDGELDDLTFTKGTNAHHAIELGTNTPTSITLRGWTVSGFSAANGNNDSVIYNNSGKTITVNVVGNSGTISYKNGASAATNIVVNPVTLSVHVQDITTQADISGARVWVPVTSSAGGYPYQASVTITSSGTTATVSHTGHGLSTNDYIHIAGANESYYNGTFQITVTGANSYTYTMASSTTSPATGTITATFVVLNGTTDVNGDISASYSYSASQPISGRARYTGYQTGAITGTISSTNGLSVTVNLVAD